MPGKHTARTRHSIVAARRAGVRDKGRWTNTPPKEPVFVPKPQDADEGEGCPRPPSAAAARTATAWSSSTR
jgi:hypothetical protein